MENEMVEVDSRNIELTKMNNSIFYERVYHSLVADGNAINYGDFCSRIMKNGAASVLKSLGLYKVKGARETKKVYAHKKLLLEIKTTIASNKEVAETVLDMGRGIYAGLPKYSIENYDAFLKLDSDYPCSVDSHKCTYLIYNETTGLHKIGRSTNIYNRLNSLRVQYSPLLELSAYLDRDVEGELHKLYMKKRVFGEWFKLTSDDVLDIKSKYDFKIIKLYAIANFQI